MKASNQPGNSLREAIRNKYSADEGSVVRDLIAQIKLDSGEREAIAPEKLVHRDWVAYVAQGRRAVVEAIPATKKSNRPSMSKSPNDDDIPKR